ncbi:MAG: protein-L-isoaspartate O-methyltransferase [Gammaproteobacteria bacterium]
MAEMNLEQARFNMIHQQIRPWEVLDDEVLGVLDRIPRDRFVPQAYRGLAYADISIPLEHGQSMMPPRLEAKLLQALAIRPTDRILEVGTGSGFLTACLATLGQHVYSVDIFSDFTIEAAKKLKEMGIENVTLETGDAINGWDKHAPYDAIAITGSLPGLPEVFKQQLAVGGRLFAVLGDEPIREATLVTRSSDTEWVSEALFETDLPELVNAPRRQTFTF